MSKCCECKHYRARLTVYKNAVNGLPMVLGECVKREPPNGVFDMQDTHCGRFEPYAVQYGVGDVFANDKECRFIEAVQKEYYPRIYRFRNPSRGGCYSISEAEMEKQGWVRIYEEVSEDE